MVDSQGVMAPETTIRALIEDIFAALGFTSGERAVLAETLLEASRAGYPSHGVMRIPTYVGNTRAGMITPAVEPVGETEAGIIRWPSAVRMACPPCMAWVAFSPRQGRALQVSRASF